MPVTAFVLRFFIFMMVLTGLTGRSIAARPAPKPARAQAVHSPVKVFILLGQSNMLGFGRIDPVDKNGTLSWLVKNQKKYQHLIDEHGEWVERKDVRNVHVMDKRGAGLTEFTVFQDVKNEWLTVKKGNIGPELQFGHIMGDIHDEPVLILKACIGNRSLGWDLLPPGSERFQFEGRTYAGYRDNPASWVEGEPGKEVNWYAGRQYDADVAHAKEVLKNLDKYYPGLPKHAGDEEEIASVRASIAKLKDFARRARFTPEGLKQHNEKVASLKEKLAQLEQGSTRYEVAGFVFWQGHKDQNAAHASRYEQNLVRFIKSLRKDFNAHDAKFVLATIAFGGRDLSGHGLTIANAQLAVSGETGKYPEFEGNVKTIDARPFWREKEVSPSGAGYHYNHNAETYMEVGNALGLAMAELLGVNEIERHFVDRAVLTTKQEKIVLELARKRGIEKVARISTYNLYPTAARGISVEGVEKIKGREASYKVLQVRFKDWWHSGQGPREGDLQAGDFWAGQPSTRKQTILKVGKKEFRTSSVHGLSIEECESILAQLLDGRYRLGPGVEKGTVGQIDWTRPQGFRKNGEAISVGFLHKSEGSGFFDLQITLGQDGLSINQLLQAVP